MSVPGHQSVYGGDEGLRHHLCLSHDEHREPGADPAEMERWHEDEHGWNPVHRGEYGCPEHTREDEPGEFHDMGGTGEIHRGIGVMLPDEVHRAVHDESRPAHERAGALLDHLTQPENRYGGQLGRHWSTDSGVAEDFAETAAKWAGAEDDRARPAGDRTWGSHDEDDDDEPYTVRHHKPGTAVVFHAHEPGLADIDNDPSDSEGMVYGHGEHGEREVPLRRHADVRLRGVSWAPMHDESDPNAPIWPEYSHHDFEDEREQHTASVSAAAAGATAGSELVGHFEAAAPSVVERAPDLSHDGPDDPPEDDGGWGGGGGGKNRFTVIRNSANYGLVNDAEYHHGSYVGYHASLEDALHHLAHMKSEGTFDPSEVRYAGKTDYKRTRDITPEFHNHYSRWFEPKSAAYKPHSDVLGAGADMSADELAEHGKTWHGHLPLDQAKRWGKAPGRQHQADHHADQGASFARGAHADACPSSWDGWVHDAGNCAYRGPSGHEHAPSMGDMFPSGSDDLLGHFEGAHRPGRGEKTCACCNGDGSHGDGSECDPCDGSGMMHSNDPDVFCPSQPQPKRRHWREASAEGEEPKTYYHVSYERFPRGTMLTARGKGWSNFDSSSGEHVYVTDSEDNAERYRYHLWEQGYPEQHKYEVRPTGPVEPDPDDPEAVRTRHPVEVTWHSDDAPDWFEPKTGAALEDGMKHEASDDMSYRMQHQGPDADDGEGMHEIGSGKIYPADIHQHPDWYGVGSETGSWDSWDKVRKSKGWPSSRVTMYRSLPSPHREVNTGDWVTSSAAYAREHGRMTNPDDDWPVVKFEARADQLRNAGDSINEWSYHGPKVNRALVHFSGGKNHRGKGPRGGKADAALHEHEPPEMYQAYQAQTAEFRRRRKEEREAKQKELGDWSTGQREASMQAEGAAGETAPEGHEIWAEPHGVSPVAAQLHHNMSTREPEDWHKGLEYHGPYHIIRHPQTRQAWLVDRKGRDANPMGGHFGNRERDGNYGESVAEGHWHGLESVGPDAHRIGTTEDPKFAVMKERTPEFPHSRVDPEDVERVNRPEPRVHKPEGNSPDDEYHGSYEVVRHPETGRYHVVDNAGRSAHVLPLNGYGTQLQAERSRDYTEHRQQSKERARGIADSLWQGGHDALDPGGTAESRQSEENTATASDMMGRYEGGKGQIKFDSDEEGGRPYYEREHHHDDGRPSGWYARHYGAPFAGVYHRATGDEQHDTIHLPVHPEDEGKMTPRIHPDFGDADLGAALKGWHDEPDGMRNHIETQDPEYDRHARKVQQWKGRRLGSAQAPPAIEVIASAEIIAHFAAGPGERAAALANPHTGGDEWYHGSPWRFGGFEGDAPHSSLGYEDDSFDTSHWNGQLGHHFAASHGVAEGFSKGEHSAEPEGSYEDREPAQNVLHARLGIRNPKAYGSEHDMDQEVYEHEFRAGNHHDAHHPEGELEEAREGGWEDELPHTYQYAGHGDRLRGKDEADPVYWEQNRQYHPYATGWLNTHPDKYDIARRHRQRLIDAGHDGITYGNEFEGEQIGKGDHHLVSAIPFHGDQIDVTQRHHADAPCVARDDAERQWPGRNQPMLPGLGEHEAADVIEHFAAAGPWMQQKLFHAQPDPTLNEPESRRHNPDDPDQHLHWRSQNDEDYEPDECEHCGGDRKMRDEHAEHHQEWLEGQDWHTDWDAEAPADGEPIHRGMATMLPKALHDRVHDTSIPVAQRAHELASHIASEGGLGNFWSSEPDVSKSYAESTQHPLRYRYPKPNGEASDQTPVMVHARFPGKEHIETDPDQLQHWGVYSYHIADNREIPIQHQAPLHITGISWADPGHGGKMTYDGPEHQAESERFDQDPHWTHHDFGDHGIQANASLAVEAAEIVAHFAMAAAAEYGPKPEFVAAPDHLSDDEKMAHWEGQRKIKDDWEGNTRRGLSMGHLTYDRARKLGYWGNGDELPDEGWDNDGNLKWRRGWQALPQQLYHVTTNLPAVRESGGLRNRRELEQHRSGGLGLGGGPDDTISLTGDHGTARNILRAMHEYHDVLNGRRSPHDMVEEARTGRGAQRPFLHDWNVFSGEAHQREGDDLARPVRDALEGHESYTNPTLRTRQDMEAQEGPGWEPEDEGRDFAGHHVHNGPWHRTPTPERRRQQLSDLYKNFSWARQHAGGHDNPLFVSNDVERFAHLNPSHFAIVHATPRPGAQGFPESSLGEWRTASGDAVQVHRAERMEGGHLKEASLTSGPDQPSAREERGDRWHELRGRNSDDLHRGIYVHLPSDLHAYVHDEGEPREDRARALREHFSADGLGMHWTPGLNIASRAVGNAADDDDGGYSGDGTGVIFHVKRPGERNRLRNPEQLEEHSIGWRYSQDEDEFPLKPGSPLRLSGISWKKHDPQSPLEPYEHADFDRPFRHVSTRVGEPMPGVLEVTASYDDDDEDDWDEEPEEESYRRVAPETDEHGFQWPMKEGMDSGERVRIDDEPPRCTTCAATAHTSYEYHWPEDGHHPDVQGRLDRDKAREDRWDRGEYDRTRFCGVGCEQGAHEDQRHGVSTGHTFSVGEPEWADNPHQHDRELWQRDQHGSPHEEPQDRRPSGYEVRNPSAEHRCHYCRNILPQYRREASREVTAGYDWATDEGPFTWGEIAQRHPRVYGDDEDHVLGMGEGGGHDIGDAAAELYHDRPSEPYSQSTGELHPENSDEMEFHPRTVDPSRIDYMRSDPGDPRVARARKGYESQTPERVPPVILVHRHGVFQVADGHHRSEGAAKARKPVRAYVAYSPHEDEPFSEGERAPYHGAETEERPPMTDQNGVPRRISYPGFPHTADVPRPMSHEAALEAGHCGDDTPHPPHDGWCGGTTFDDYNASEPGFCGNTRAHSDHGECMGLDEDLPVRENSGADEFSMSHSDGHGIDPVFGSAGAVIAHFTPQPVIYADVHDQVPALPAATGSFAWQSLPIPEDREGLAEVLREMPALVGVIRDELRALALRLSEEAPLHPSVVDMIWDMAASCRTAQEDMGRLGIASPEGSWEEPGSGPKA